MRRQLTAKAKKELKQKLSKLIARKSRQLTRYETRNQRLKKVRSSTATVTKINKELIGVNPKRSRAEIQMMQRALKNMQQKSYGICLTCDRPIPLRRLRTIPYAQRCVPCIRAIEAGNHG